MPFVSIHLSEWLADNVSFTAMDGPPACRQTSFPNWVESNGHLWKQTNSRNSTVIDQELIQGISSLSGLIFYRKIM